MGQINGLLAPYMGVNSSSSTNQPLYENKANQIIGGMTLGSQIGNSLKGFNWGGLFGGGGGENYSGNPTTNYSTLANTFTFG